MVDTADNILDELFKEIPPPRTLTEINEYVKRAGVNPDKFSKHTRMLITTALQMARAQIAKENNEKT